MILTDLILNRGFDRYQKGLKARFYGYGLRYELIYCEPTLNTAMQLNFESPLHMGQVTVWESGLCDLDVLDIKTEQTVLYEHHELKSELEFHHIYPKLVIFMRDALI